MTMKLLIAGATLAALGLAAPTANAQAPAAAAPGQPAQGPIQAPNPRPRAVPTRSGTLTLKPP
jgi:hypothetical protein